jgi:hypothetical protein
MTIQLLDPPSCEGARAAHPASPLSSELLDIIRAEYREMPCMRLTRSQFRRLWGLEPSECEAAIAVLRDEGFLDQDDHGQLYRALDPGM